MALILSIDASAEKATVVLAENGVPVAVLTNEVQKTHATWIHSAIADCFKSAGAKISDLQAVGLTSGPGSYTGLRVGMATAKGICYALNVPLVAVNSLLAIASSAKAVTTDFICSMMDAGRMEVYAALYTTSLEEISEPAAIILDADSFSAQLERNSIIFIGSGKNKFERICHNSNAIFGKDEFDASDFSSLIYTKFIQSDFASLAYLEPLYLKEYRSHIN
jgi:tRNA threonylcarbamoyladenosine biosynthesis protein TsaB